MTNDDDDDAQDPTVPVSFAQTVAKRPPPRDAEEFRFDAMIGKQVVVMTQGFIVRGLLIGAGDGELHIRGQQRFITLAIDDVSDVKLADDR